MASPKNWKRVKSKESKSKPFYWKNRERDAWIWVEDISRGKGPAYSVKLGGMTGTSQGSLNIYSNKEDARKRAVRWMRKHALK